jgi:hypothetical protein
MRGHRVGGALCAAVVTLAVTGCAHGGVSARQVAQVAQYTKADRTNMLVEGAKKEKRLVWYTTLIPTEVSKPMADAFHRNVLSSAARRPHGTEPDDGPAAT